MKFHPIIAVAVLALAVSACQEETPAPPDDTVTVPNETTPPDRNHDPCTKTNYNAECP